MAVIEEKITEGRLLFTFPTGAMSSKYDDWSHYRNQFVSGLGGNKAVDIVYSSQQIAWLIEVKDYREHQRTKAMDLAEEVAIKVRDTLAGLVSAHALANDADERRVASAMLKKRGWRVVLHLELPAIRSRLRPQVIDPDKVLFQLKRLVKAIDPHPAVVTQNTLQPSMDWIVKG